MNKLHFRIQAKYYGEDWVIIFGYKIRDLKEDIALFESELVKNEIRNPSWKLRDTYIKISNRLKMKYVGV